MRKTKPLVSLVIPVHNESGNLEWHAQKIADFFADKDYAKETIYIDDGSTDNSLEIIKQLASEDKSVRYVSFSRNFGKEAATTAGLRKSRGDVVIMIDADGQHPVETVESFLEQWYNDFDVVIGVRKSNIREGLVKRYGSRVFNRLLTAISNQKAVSGATDFRLLDRKVVDAFNQLTERNRITRGLTDWLGFKRAFVDFDAPERHSGKASYSFNKLVSLAVHAFVSHSTKPLQFTGFVGSVVMLLSAVTGIFLLIEGFFLGDPLELNVTGSAILAVFLSFLVGLVLICQWLLALYIESIHNETQNRPLYIVDEED